MAGCEKYRSPANAAHELGSIKIFSVSSKSNKYIEIIALYTYECYNTKEYNQMDQMEYGGFR